jgi:hypothetical protein
MEQDRLIVEFPPETAAVIYRLAASLKLEPGKVISKALGLLELWEEARRNQRVIVERPVVPGTGKEFEIVINPS